MTEKLTFFPNLYLGDSINIRDLDKLKQDLQKNPLLSKTFLISLSTNPNELLDILEAKFSAFPYYNEHPLQVIGLAGSNSEAVKLVEKIVQNCLDSRGDVNIKEFLMEKV